MDEIPGTVTELGVILRNKRGLSSNEFSGTQTRGVGIPDSNFPDEVTDNQKTGLGILVFVFVFVFPFTTTINKIPQP